MSECIISHNRVIAHPDDAEAVARAVSSGQWACGPETRALEKELADYVGRKHGVAVASGTAALRLALHGLGIGQDDEVIVPAYSCVSLAHAVLSIGAVPIPADVLPGSWCLSPASVEQNLSSRTRAAIAVHMFGAKAPVEQVATLGLPVVEDCAHGFGATPFSLGTTGRLAITSLYATKFLGAGEGGVIFTDDDDEAVWLRSFRDYTDQAAHPFRGNDKISDLEAALARSRLTRIDGALRWRNALAARYHAVLSRPARLCGLALPDPADVRIWYRYVVLLPESAPRKEGAAMLADCLQALDKLGIRAARPVERWDDVLPCPKRRKEERDLPVAGMAFHRLLSLPFHEAVSEDDVARVVDALICFVKEYEKNG